MGDLEGVGVVRNFVRGRRISDSVHGVHFPDSDILPNRAAGGVGGISWLYVVGIRCVTC